MKLETRNPKLETGLWDAIIVGAGVAGGVVAAKLAERGWRVLLLEKNAWPREKACGGCLNAAGVEMLADAGLENVLRNAGEMTRMELCAGSRMAAFPLPLGAVVERRCLDARLAQSAVERGCMFLPEAAARLLPQNDDAFRAVQITTGAATHVAHGRLILACDGLGRNTGGFLAVEPWAATRVAKQGRLGFATTIL